MKQILKKVICNKLITTNISSTIKQCINKNKSFCTKSSSSPPSTEELSKQKINYIEESNLAYSDLILIDNFIKAKTQNNTLHTILDPPTKSKLKKKWSHESFIDLENKFKSRITFDKVKQLILKEQIIDININLSLINYLIDSNTRGVNIDIDKFNNISDDSIKNSMFPYESKFLKIEFIYYKIILRNISKNLYQVQYETEYLTREILLTVRRLIICLNSEALIELIHNKHLHKILTYCFKLQSLKQINVIEAYLFFFFSKILKKKFTSEEDDFKLLSLINYNENNLLKLFKYGGSMFQLNAPDRIIQKTIVALSTVKSNFNINFLLTSNSNREALKKVKEEMIPLLIFLTNFEKTSTSSFILSDLNKNLEEYLILLEKEKENKDFNYDTSADNLNNTLCEINFELNKRIKVLFTCFNYYEELLKLSPIVKYIIELETSFILEHKYRLTLFQLNDLFKIYSMENYIIHGRLPLIKENFLFIICELIENFVNSLNQFTKIIDNVTTTTKRLSKDSKLVISKENNRGFNSSTMFNSFYYICNLITNCYYIKFFDSNIHCIVNESKVSIIPSFASENNDNANINISFNILENESFLQLLINNLISILNKEEAVFNENHFLFYDTVISFFNMFVLKIQLNKNKSKSRSKDNKNISNTDRLFYEYLVEYLDKTNNDVYVESSDKELFSANSLNSTLILFVQKYYSLKDKLNEEISNDINETEYPHDLSALEEYISECNDIYYENDEYKDNQEIKENPPIFICTNFNDLFVITTKIISNKINNKSNYDIKNFNLVVMSLLRSFIYNRFFDENNILLTKEKNINDFELEELYSKKQSEDNEEDIEYSEIISAKYSLTQEQRLKLLYLLEIMKHSRDIIDYKIILDQLKRDFIGSGKFKRFYVMSLIEDYLI